jgi:hypothetical protein
MAVRGRPLSNLIGTFRTTPVSTNKGHPDFADGCFPREPVPSGLQEWHLPGRERGVRTCRRGASRAGMGHPDFPVDVSHANRCHPDFGNGIFPDGNETSGLSGWVPAVREWVIRTLPMGAARSERRRPRRLKVFVFTYQQGTRTSPLQVWGRPRPHKKVLLTHSTAIPSTHFGG